jgi:hypothetical protein
VCAELRAGLLGDLCFEKLPPVSWELLIESSSHHNVTPALSWCLKDKAVPPDIRSYFDAAGFGHVLASYLKFAEVFFGQTAPRLSNLPRKLALERLRVFVEWPDRAKRRAAYITLTEENQALRSQLDALQQQLASVYSSTSWKISSPLRKVRQLIQLPRFGGPRRKAASCRSPASA